MAYSVNWGIPNIMPPLGMTPGGYSTQGGVQAMPSTAYAMSMSPGATFGGGAGMHSYTPSVTTPPSAWQPPVFTNSMSNWLGASQGDAGDVNWGNLPTQYASPMMALGLPGGAAGTGLGTTLNSNPGSSLGNMASYAAPAGLMSVGGQQGGYNGVGYPAYNAGAGNGASWPSNFGGTPGQPSLSALTSGIYGRESQYGTYPGAAGTDPSNWTMDRWGAVGPMQMNKGSMAAVGMPASALWNWDSNMAGGRAYANQQLQAFNQNPYTAAAAYNWGPGNVAKTAPQNYPTSVKNYGHGVVNSMVDYGQEAGRGAMTGDVLMRLLH